MNYFNLRTPIIVLIFLCGASMALSAGGGRESQEATGTDTAKLYNTKDFDQVEINGNFSFTIRQGQDFLVKAETTTNSLKKLSVEQFGSKLVIKRQSSFFDGMSKGTVHIEIVMPKIKGLYVGGASNGTILMDNRSVEVSNFVVDGSSELELNCIAKNIAVSNSGASKLTGRLVAETTSLKFSGSSKGRLKLEANSLSSELTGASGLTISGKANTLASDLSGASDLNAKEFTCLVADIGASGASHAALIVNQTAKFEASGASHIDYTGSATPSVNESSGASSIRKVEAF